MFIDDARINGRQAVQETVEKGLWKRNEEFSKTLDDIINKHRFLNHPIYQMKESHFPNDKAWTKIFYLGAGKLTYLITNAVINALNTSIQLQSRLGIKAVYSARFLLQINLLDELGFKPELVKEGCYAGHPNLSHFMLLVETLSQIGVSLQELESYQPSDENRTFHDSFENNYKDYTRLICVLALFDKVFLNTMAEWLLEVAKFSGIDISTGYYSIDVGEDDAADTWYLFQQAMIPERYDEIRLLIEETLENWAVWSDRLLEQLN